MRVSGIGRRWRLVVALVLVSVMIGSSASAVGVSESAGPGRYIVVFRDGVDPHPAAQALGRAYGFSPVHVYEHALSGFAAVVPPARLAMLAADPRVAYIEPDLVMHIMADTWPTGVNRVGAQYHPTFPSPGGSVNVNVAIIDTGIDLTHPDLNVVGNVTYVSRTSNGNDDHGHGTHVAGTVAAKYNGSGVVGVAPGAGLYAVKVLNRQGSGYLTDIIKGIDWVTANATSIQVANMSLGGTGFSESYRSAIAKSVQAGVVYVVAAGNSSQDVYGKDGVFGNSDDYIPASYPEAMAVSALADSDGKAGGTGSATSYGPDDTLATFSNFSGSVVSTNTVTSSGKAIDVAAPGVSIYSTYKGGGYATMSGTSMAAPHVAGIVALYIAQNGRANDATGVYSIRQAIINGAQPQTEWGPSDTKDPDSSKEGMALAGTPVAAPGVSVSPTPQTGGAFPGGTATYEFTVTNTGSVAGSYTASPTTANSGWGVNVTPTSFDLAAKAQRTVTVSHTVPAWAAVGDKVSGTLKVSVDGTTTEATASFTTTAKGYGVEITPPSDAKSGAPGSDVTYSFTVKNVGTEADSFALSVAGATWTATPSPTPVSLAAGVSATVTVTHSIPSIASEGAMDGGTLTAVSAGDSAKTATASFTTTAVEASTPTETLIVNITLGGSPKPGDNVEVLVTVTDSVSGSRVAGASVSLSLATTGGKTYTAAGTTNDQGIYKARIKTAKTDLQPWTISATAIKNGATGSGTLIYP